MSLRWSAWMGLAVLVSPPAFAADRWEIRGDGGPWTYNQLQPGIVQEGHDIGPQGAKLDEDWYKVREEPGHSYEARVFGGSVVWKYGACPDCARFDRVDDRGNVLVKGDYEDILEVAGLAVRWINTDGGLDMLRAMPGPAYPGNPEEKYDVMLVDTTLLLPRFNNTGSQRTVIVLQNVRNREVSGRVAFHATNGQVLHTQSFDLKPMGSLVLDTSSVPQLAEQSGSAVIAHLGGWGGLAGKAVALDPGTGFSFDTPLTGVFH